MESRKAVIIVAGGSGTRMGSDIPKQFILLKGVPVLMHTIKKFNQTLPDSPIIVVLPLSEIAKWEELCKQYHFKLPHRVTTGGKNRFDSVKNGLALIDDCDLVAIHDGVRPLVSSETIHRTFTAALLWGSVIPTLPVNESLREGTTDFSVAVDRSRYFMVQTPQVFRYSLLKEAYQQPYDPTFTDDASVVEKAGHLVQMVPGNRENIKITHPEDLQIAALWID